jgi:hypothetical protein
LTYFSLGSGILALGIEVFIGLSLLEMPPFGKGGSDIVWALPFFALVIFALAMPGLLAALSATRIPTRAGKFAMAGLVLKRGYACDSNFTAGDGSGLPPHLTAGLTNR